jgi:N-acetylglutamate synthase-like GNAT family acetyltransferase
VTELVVQPATAADRSLVRALLGEARLPTEDLDRATDLTFWVARSDFRPLGAVGLERHGNIGLLRSLVVAPNHRLHGVGRALVRALEEHAVTEGLVQLVLLTETAEPFFRRVGYAVIGRDEAPSVVASSAQFREQCPVTAVCMTKLL